MWKDLTREWQMTFELTWEAFKRGSIPIGAMIFDEDGNILSAGRNHMGDRDNNTACGNRHDTG